MAKPEKKRETPMPVMPVKMLTQSLEMWPAAKMKHHPDNANQGDRQAIAESIDQVGFYGAIIVQKSTGYILAGNHTYDSGMSKGMMDFPVIALDVDDQTALEILLGDNRIAQLSKYDEAKLSAAISKLREMTGGQRTAGGYTAKDMTKLLDRFNKPEMRASEAGQHAPTHIDRRWGVMVECRDETHQVDLLERFATEGLTCRALIS